MFLHAFISIILALFLQWSTAGAAVLISALTPTTGLGCRGAAYLAYLIFGTLSFALILGSSVVAHASRSGIRLGDSDVEGWVKGHTSVFLGHLATILRRTGKFIAFINALWILTASLFQFSSFYNTCYCESSALSRGVNKAYILFLTGDDLIGMGTRKVWIGGVLFACGASVLFLGVVQVCLWRVKSLLGD